MSAPVAVVILNWNGESMMRRFLPEVVANTDSSLAEIVVADNGSTDGSVAMLRSEFPSVRILELGENFGFAEGYNRAIAMLDNQYIVMLNSDVAADPGWVRPLFDFMESHPDFGACQPKILSFSSPGSFEYAGACGGFIDCNGYPYCRGRIFDTTETDHGQYDRPAEVYWASGAALMVHRVLYLEVGGMDKDFFAHMEEIDLCWRIRLAGYRIAAIPESSVRHLGGGTLAAGDPKKTYLNFRNNLLLLHKNLPDGVRGWRLFVRRLYDGLAWLKFVASADMANAKALLRAHKDFRRMRRGCTVHPDRNLLPSRPNAVIGYYLLGRRTYDKLRK